jgi:hypothetical protein
MSATQRREGETAIKLRCGTTGCRRRVKWVDEERLVTDSLRYLCADHWQAMKSIRLPDADRYKPLQFPEVLSET